MLRFGYCIGMCQDAIEAGVVTEITRTFKNKREFKL
jgi:hypothetical protein